MNLYLDRIANIKFKVAKIKENSYVLKLTSGLKIPLWRDQWSYFSQRISEVS